MEAWASEGFSALSLPVFRSKDGAWLVDYVSSHRPHHVMNAGIAVGIVGRLPRIREMIVDRASSEAQSSIERSMPNLAHVDIDN
jgi:hypothetical protein